MSTLHDASGGGTAAAGADGTGGLLENPDGVALSFTAPGWTGPIWRCNRLLVSRIGRGRVTWDRYDIRTVYLSHVAALLASQGLPVNELFPSSGYFSSIDGLQTGPFVYLAGELAPHAEPPARVLNVVLARIVSTPSGLSMAEVLGELVETVLASR